MINITARSYEEVLEFLCNLQHHILPPRRVKISDKVRTMLYQRQKGKCALSGEHLMMYGPFKCHADHIVPLHLGGTDDIQNLQLVTPAENLRKGARDPIEYAQSRLGRLL